MEREAARAAGEDALELGQPARGQERVAVGHRDPAVDHRGVERLGPEVLADALDQVRADVLGPAGVDRPLGVGADHDEVGVALAQVAGGAGDRAAGADAGDEVGDLPGGLLPDLGSGRLVVGLRVGLVEVLVGLERARDLGGEPVGHAVVGLRRVGRDVGRGEHDLGAVGAEQIDLLARHLVRHHRDHAVALQPRRDREPGAGVARGRLDDRAAGLQPAVALGGLDQRHRDAVLDRAARVERLELGDQPRAQPGADARQPDSGVSPIVSRIESFRIGCDGGIGHGPRMMILRTIHKQPKILRLCVARVAIFFGSRPR